jgi:radical SAM protein with 4Fe4S-binding SPASM domain
MATLVPPLPTEVQFEVTASCNLRCRMCLVRYQPPLNKIEGSLSYELFKRVVDALPRLRKVTLQGLGEPLLAPDLFRMIEYASGRNIAMGFNTNGTLLTAGKAERLVRGGLSWLCVSLDGATATTFEGVRDGAAFERVRSNVLGLLDVKRTLNASDPDVSLVFVAMRRNVQELPALIRLAAEWGITKVRVQNLSHSFSDTDPAGKYREIREFTAAEALWQRPDPAAAASFDRAQREATERGVQLRLPELADRLPHRKLGTPGCIWPWTDVYITHDGKVEPCCMVMGSDRATLGDLNVDDFATVWAGEPYVSFRRALLTDEPPAVCQGCSMYRGVF